VVGGDGALDYLVFTTHPRSKDLALRGAAVSSSADAPDAQAVAAAQAQLRRDAASTARNIAFKKLSITKSEAGGNAQEQWVTYRATYVDRSADKPRKMAGKRVEVEQMSSLAERARFLASGTGSWLYFGATPLSGSKALGSYDAASEVQPPPAPAA
jgi:hypothetical protein